MSASLESRRQRLYRVQAVVLKRMDYGEADRILTLYTQQQGKVRAIAKGSRRTTSRSGGHLELFALVDLQLARGRELDVVSQAETAESFRRVREDLELTSHAYYLAELVDLLTEDRMENSAVFAALLDSLAALEAGADVRLVVVAFQLRLLDALGYRPELTECVSCRTAIEPGRNAFSSRLGGVLCPACAPREPSASRIDSDVLKLLRNLQRTPNRLGLRAPEHLLRDLERRAREYSEHVVERSLRTPQLIQRVNEAGAAYSAD